MSLTNPQLGGTAGGSARHDPRTMGMTEYRRRRASCILGVVERMYRCDNYAPVMLPANARVLLPTGDVMPLTEE